jgi:K+-transporting ATPase ATPase A chain
MNAFGIVQIVVYMVVLLALAKPLGWYMWRVYEGGGPAWLERPLYRLSGVREETEMDWKQYAIAMLLFCLLGFLAVYALQRFQGALPLNPQGFGPVTADSSFNTAVSFSTNTNWQGYGGETTMSYLTQMLGLAVQNFVSAASGMATLVAVARGLYRRSAQTIGNFWVDLVRTTLYILLPLSIVLTLVLVSQGVVQNFSAYASATTSEGIEQVLPMGPAASQIAIKQLGTNGGGFFNVNSSHPFENATPLSNFFEMLAILLIPAALCYTYGKLIRDTRQGWAVLVAMTLMFVPLMSVAVGAEANGNPAIAALGIDQADGNMEGKDVRFGIANSALWASATTAASNGSVNSMHDSYTPIGGFVPMWLMQLGEVIYGGVGSGLYGMLIFVILAVFIAGLMVGRTPEYLGKKLEAHEVKMSLIAVLVPPAVVLLGTAASVMFPAGTAGVQDAGPHGFSEVLYAFSSMGNNNGSAFAGFGANNVFTNTAGGIAMLFARYWVAIPALAIAGSMVRKRSVPPSLGTLPTHTPLFVVVLIGTVLLIGALTFLPALALGPFVEQLAQNAGRQF